MLAGDRTGAVVVAVLVLTSVVAATTAGAFVPARSGGQATAAVDAPTNGGEAAAHDDCIATITDWGLQRSGSDETVTGEVVAEAGTEFSVWVEARPQAGHCSTQEDLKGEVDLGVYDGSRLARSEIVCRKELADSEWSTDRPTVSCSGSFTVPERDTLPDDEVVVEFYGTTYGYLDASESVTIRVGSIDAEIESFDEPSGTEIRGEDVDADVTVENTGDFEHTFFVGYGVYDESGGYHDDDGSTGTTVTLAPGESEAVDVEWDSTGAPTGEYDARTSVWRESDRDELATRLADSREYDAFTLEAETVDAAIDSWSEPTGSYTRGDPVSADVTVRNTGNVEHTFFVGYGVYDESGDLYQNDGTTGTAVSLDPGETDTVTVTWDSTGAPAERYDARVSVWKESDRDDLDTRLADDRRHDVFELRKPVGATITDWSPPSGSYTRGDEVTATVTVENVGSSRRSFFVGYGVYDDSGGYHDEGGSTGTPVTLDPGESETVTVGWDSTDAPTGRYDARVSVWKESDPANLDTRLADRRENDAFALQRGSCADDTFEENDDRASAAEIASGEYTGLTSCFGETDAFAVELSQDAELTAAITFAHDDGNLDLRLVGPDGSVVAASTSSTDDEEISATASADGRYTLLVENAGETTVPYSLSVSRTDTEGPTIADVTTTVNEDDSVTVTAEVTDDGRVADVNVRYVMGATHTPFDGFTTVEMAHVEGDTWRATTPPASEFDLVRGWDADSDHLDLKVVAEDDAGNAATGEIHHVHVLNETGLDSVRPTDYPYVDRAGVVRIPMGAGQHVEEIHTHRTTGDFEVTYDRTATDRPNTYWVNVSVERPDGSSLDRIVGCGQNSEAECPTHSQVLVFYDAEQVTMLERPRSELEDGRTWELEMAEALATVAGLPSAPAKITAGTVAKWFVAQVGDELATALGFEAASDVLAPSIPPEIDRKEGVNYLQVDFCTEDTVTGACAVSKIEDYRLSMKLQVDGDVEESNVTVVTDLRGMKQTDVYPFKTVAESRRDVTVPLDAPADVTEKTARVDGFAAPSGSFEPGEEVAADVTVTNVGTEADRFFVGYDAVGPDGRHYNGGGSTGTAVPLDPGESKTVTVSWTVPDDAPAGSYDAVTAVWQEADRDALETKLDGSTAPEAFEVTGTAPAVRVDSARTQVDDRTTVDVTLSGAPEGLAGFEFTLDVADGAVASVTEATSSLGLEDVTVGEDGRTITVAGADVEDAVAPDATDVTLATVTLRGTGDGSTTLRLDDVRVENESGRSVAVRPTDGSVVVGALPTVGDAPPTDPDEDGVYEDVNGNGRLDYDDVVTLFDNLDSPAVADRPDLFDLNGNGRVDYDDLQRLVEEVR